MIPTASNKNLLLDAARATVRAKGNSVSDCYLKEISDSAVRACLLASCSTPSSNDGQQRVLAVVNEGSVPIIALYAGRSGTTPGSRQPTLELLSSNAEGMVDFLPLGANIPAGKGGKFNIDDGNGTCVFEVYVKFLDGVSQKNEGDVCKLAREGTVWLVSN